MPEPRGQGFVISSKVNADHASDSVTRRSKTGFLVWINTSLVYFLSKTQTSVETSSFGPEFVAMKQCCEYLRGLRYNLRMMGIPVNDPCHLWRQPVGTGKHDRARLHTKEEVAEYCIPIYP
jgi:hypothetical protein